MGSKNDFGKEFQDWVNEHKDLKDKLKEIIDQVCEDARMEAIAKAQDATPPLQSEAIHGKNTRTGTLKGQWEEDTTELKYEKGKGWSFTLYNSKHYTSYLNDGHAMDRHFVPGLFINPYNNLLEYDERMVGKKGIIVGTKTKFVPGYYMLEAGIKGWEDWILNRLDNYLEDL